MILLSSAEICDLLTVSPGTLAMIRRENPAFPPPVQITPRRHAWRFTDIERFIESLPYSESSACSRTMATS